MCLKPLNLPVDGINRFVYFVPIYGKKNGSFDLKNTTLYACNDKEYKNEEYFASLNQDKNDFQS